MKIECPHCNKEFDYQDHKEIFQSLTKKFGDMFEEKIRTGEMSTVEVLSLLNCLKSIYQRKYCLEGTR